MSPDSVAGIEGSRPVEMNLSVTRPGRSRYKERGRIVHGHRRSRHPDGGENGTISQATGSSSRTASPRTGSTGVRSTGRSSRRSSMPWQRRRRDHLASNASCTWSMGTSEPIPPIASTSGSSPSWHGTRCSPSNYSVVPPRKSSPASSPSSRSSRPPRSRRSPERDGTNSEALIGLDLERKQVLIVGTEYAGEMKKSIFTSANYLLPADGVLPMHCSANLGPDGRRRLVLRFVGDG